MYEHWTFLIPEPNSELPRLWAPSEGRKKRVKARYPETVSFSTSCHQFTTPAPTPHVHTLSNILSSGGLGYCLIFWRTLVKNLFPQWYFCVYQHSFLEALLIHQHLLWNFILYHNEIDFQLCTSSRNEDKKDFPYQRHS